MHFYEFNIGDFAKKTQHLTNEEELAYRRALDMYYDTEKPLLTSGLATLSRRLRVSENALKNVLDEFFPDGKNKHADEKIAAYYEYIEKQKANGRKGGRPKNDSNKPTANPLVSQNNPVPSQPLTTKPLTTNHNNKIIVDCKEVLEYLNNKVSRNYKPVKSNLSFLEARIREGYTKEDLIRVIDVKASKWLGDEKMNEFLRPATLFNATKFSQYVVEKANKLNVSDYL